MILSAWPGRQPLQKKGLPFYNITKKDPDKCLNLLMDGEGFEPSKALLTDLQSAPFGHSGIHP